MIRAILNIEKWVNELKKSDRNECNDLIRNWDNEKNLNKMISFISKRLNSLF